MQYTHYTTFSFEVTLHCRSNLCFGSCCWSSTGSNLFTLFPAATLQCFLCFFSHFTKTTILSVAKFLINVKPILMKTVVTDSEKD